MLFIDFYNTLSRLTPDYSEFLCLFHRYNICQLKSMKKVHMKEAKQETEEKEPNLQSLQIL